ncbi:MAG: CpaE-like family protein [Actinomycetia bacterium]|nr:CpaE-like family protein [Actinomycetes bacterium]
MTPSARILAVIDDQSLYTDTERVAAAAGLPLVRTSDPSSRQVWTNAAAILLDTEAARRCAERGLPRRALIFLTSQTRPGPADWEAAVAVGAQRVVALPADDRELMAILSDAAELWQAPTTSPDGTRGPVVAVLPGRGGAGASVFATALALVATQSLLIDGDPWGGGLDLVLGTETESGLRWPDLPPTGGRLNYPALRDALPRRQGVSLLSGGRVFGADPPRNDVAGVADVADSRDIRDVGDIRDIRDIRDVGSLPLAAVIEAGSRAGVPVVCDLARHPTGGTEAALGAADLVVLVTTADVRSCAASAAIAKWAAAANPNTGVLVRGPAPGGLRPIDIARILGLPVLASMRPEPGIRTRLECGGLRLRRRSPLSGAARKVLGTLRQSPHPGRVLEFAP